MNCTDCEKGVFDYSNDKLYCDGKEIQSNKACEKWSKENSCRVTSRGWNTFKRSGHQ